MFLFIVVENYNKGREPQCTSLEDLSFKTAFLIGCFQVLSVIPGTSRSGSTIIGGILVGTSRTVAAEFTFFLGIPVMFGASLLKILKFGFSFTGTEVLILVVGMVVAFVVSILAIKFLMGYIKKHDFKAFGWYRIVLVRWCWFILWVRLYWHKLQIRNFGVSLQGKICRLAFFCYLNVLVVIPDAISQCIFTAARRNVPAS